MFMWQFEVGSGVSRILHPRTPSTSRIAPMSLKVRSLLVAAEIRAQSSFKNILQAFKEFQFLYLAGVADILVRRRAVQVPRRPLVARTGLLDPKQTSFNHRGVEHDTFVKEGVRCSSFLAGASGQFPAVSPHP